VIDDLEEGRDGVEVDVERYILSGRCSTVS